MHLQRNVIVRPCSIKREMNNPQLYQEYNNLPKRDVKICLREYGDRIRWQWRDRVADLGCGDGGITDSLLRDFLPPDFAQLTGCDVSADMVKYARAHYADERTDFRELDLGAPLPVDMRGNFDHVFSFYALHWVYDQKRAFTNIYDMLAPGGDCLLMFMARQPFVDVWRALAMAHPAWRARVLTRDLGFVVYHDSQEPEQEVRTLMKNIGFKDILVERKVMKYTYESLDRYIGDILAVSPFDIPDELREEHVRAHLQIVRDLSMPTWRLEESADTPGRGRLHRDYSIIIASGRK